MSALGKHPTVDGIVQKVAAFQNQLQSAKEAASLQQDADTHLQAGIAPQMVQRIAGGRLADESSDSGRDVPGKQANGAGSKQEGFEKAWPSRVF